jgi:hypothetical protein
VPEERSPECANATLVSRTFTLWSGTVTLDRPIGLNKKWKFVVFLKQFVICPYLMVKTAD